MIQSKFTSPDSMLRNPDRYRGRWRILDQQHTSFFDSFISKKVSELGNWKCRLNERPLHVGKKRKFKNYALIDI